MGRQLNEAGETWGDDYGLDLPRWIRDLQAAHKAAIASAKVAHAKGDEFMSGFHSGRAQVLDSWILSAQIGETAAGKKRQV